MVLPIVLGLAGLAGMASGGSTMLQRHLAQQDASRQQAQRRQMIEQAMSGAMDPVQLVGPQQPGAQPGQVDPTAFAWNLIEQGMPEGFNLLGQQQSQQAAMNRLLQQQDFQREMMAAQPQGPQRTFLSVPGLGDVPIEPVGIGSKEWMDLQKERQNLGRVYDILSEFRETLQESGTTSIGAQAQKLGALRNEMLNALAATTEAGALQEAEIEFFGQRIPDPTRWTPEFIGQESGKLEAMADWYNAQVMGWQQRARMTGGLAPLRTMPSESMVPAGFEPVDEAEIGEPVGPRRPVSAREPGVPTLDELIRRSEAGGYVSPAEWRGQ